MSTSGRLMNVDRMVVQYSSCTELCLSTNVTDSNCEDPAGKDIGGSGLMQVSISLSNSLSHLGRGACSPRNLSPSRAACYDLSRRERHFPTDENRPIPGMNLTVI
jgi:hypothetical protein